MCPGTTWESESSISHPSSYIRLERTGSARKQRTALYCCHCEALGDHLERERERERDANTFLGICLLTLSLPSGRHMTSLANPLTSTCRTSFDVLLEFQLFTYTDIKQPSKSAFCFVLFVCFWSAKKIQEGNCVKHFWGQ